MLWAKGELARKSSSFRAEVHRPAPNERGGPLYEVWLRLARLPRRATILLILASCQRCGFPWDFQRLMLSQSQQAISVFGSMPDEPSLGYVPVALSPRDRFVEYLQSRGMRVTQQRLSLVDHV